MFIVMSNKMEKFRDLSISQRNKKFCDQNVRTLLSYKTWIVASLIPKFLPSDPDIIFLKI